MATFFNHHNELIPLITSQYYWDIWNKLYGENDPPRDENGDEDEDIVHDFTGAGEDPVKLEKMLYKWLCITEDSSSYAEDFGTEELNALTCCIINKVPHKLPSRLFGPLVRLLIFVTFGYDDDEGDDPNNWPCWLFPLLDACLRCAELSLTDPTMSYGHLQAIDGLISSRKFRKVTSRFRGIDTIYQSAIAIVNVAVTKASGTPPLPVTTIYCAIELLCSRLRISQSATDEKIMELFQPINEFFIKYVAMVDLLDSTDPNIEKGPNYVLLLASFNDILPAISVLLKLPNADQQVFGTGLVNALISFALQRLCNKPQPTLDPKEHYHEPSSTYAALSSVASFLSRILIPKNIKLTSPEEMYQDDIEMKKLFDQLVAQYGSRCDAIIELKGDVVIAEALIRNESRDHLQTPHPLHLSGLLALLAFSSEQFTIKMIQRLEPFPNFTACLRAHASSQMWTYSGKSYSRIMGTTKQGVVAQLILCCAIPAQCPQHVLSDDEDSSAQSKAARVEVSPKMVIGKAIAGSSNNIFGSSANIDDWMMCLACL